MSSLVRILSLGRFARVALAPGEARLIAVFEHSAYVETAAGLACIGAVGNGPLNAHCDALPSGLAVDNTVNVDLAGAVLWRLRPAPEWDVRTVRGSLEQLRTAARGRLPAQGFGFLLDSGRERPAPVRALAYWLANPEGVPSGAAGLIGLGPGLTPAGDDLIGGGLCALHATGRGVIATRLAAWALPRAREGTNRISYAHLACAAEGECAEAVNEAIVAILAGGTVNLTRIDSIGHTSGWDALAGAVVALDALTALVESPISPSVNTVPR